MGKLCKRSEQRKRELQIRAKALSENGYSDTEISTLLGISKGTLRNLLKENEDTEISALLGISKGTLKNLLKENENAENRDN